MIHWNHYWWYLRTMGRLDCDSSEMEEEELLVHSVLTLVVQSWLIMWKNL